MPKLGPWRDLDERTGRRRSSVLLNELDGVSLSVFTFGDLRLSLNLIQEIVNSEFSASQEQVKALEHLVTSLTGGE